MINTKILLILNRILIKGQVNVVHLCSYTVMSTGNSFFFLLFINCCIISVATVNLLLSITVFSTENGAPTTEERRTDLENNLQWVL